MDASDSLKLFAMTNQLLEHDLDRIEREHAIDLRRGHRSVVEADESYYPQIESAIRAQAAAMAPHYEVFYSLETSIRTVIADSLEAEEGEQWWDTERVPQKIQQEAKDRRQKEIDTGVTPRSDELIDYTT